MRRVSADIVIAVLLLVLCGALFADTFRFQLPPLADFGIKMWPRAVIAALAVLSFLYLIRSLRRPAAERRPFAWRTWAAANRNVLACFGLFALFILTLPLFGMLVGGILFVYGLLAVMGGGGLRDHATHGAVAVFFVGGMWALFTFALGVIMPGGVFNL